MPRDLFMELENQQIQQPRDLFQEIGYQPKKDVLDIMAGGSPEELAKQGHWVGAGIQQTGKDVLTIPAHFFNQLLLNYPRSLIKSMGYEYPEKAKSPIAQTVAKGAGIAGGIETPIFKVLGLTTKGLKAGQLALRSGIMGGLYAPSENPWDLKERAINTILSAGTPVILQKTGQAITKIPVAKNRFAGKIINSLIKPLKKDFSYGKNPGLAVAQEKIIANNLDDLAEKIGQRRQEIGQQIDDILTIPQNQNKRINIEGSLQPINNAMQVAIKQNNQTLLDRLVEAKRAITQNLVEGMEEGRMVIKSSGDKNLKNLTPLEARKIKSEIGDLTKWTGSPTDDKLVNKALKQVYGSIKEKISNAIPEIRNLNERYADLISAENATRYREVILQRQNLIGFDLARNTLGAGLITAIISGGRTLPTILGSATAAELTQVLKSPKIMTRLAALLSTSTPQQRQTIFSKLPQLKEVLLRGSVGFPSRLIDKIKNE